MSIYYSINKAAGFLTPEQQKKLAKEMIEKADTELAEARKAARAPDVVFGGTRRENQLTESVCLDGGTGGADEDLDGIWSK